MSYWIVSLPREDMENCIRIGTFGLGRKHSISRVKAGDRVICCSTKEWKILGVGDVTSDYYVDTTPIFLKPGAFPDRFDFKGEVIHAAKQADFKDLLPVLKCVKKLDAWPVYFRNGITEIGEEDWVTVENYIREQINKADGLDRSVI